MEPMVLRCKDWKTSASWFEDLIETHERDRKLHKQMNGHTTCIFTWSFLDLDFVWRAFSKGYSSGFYKLVKTGWWRWWSGLWCQSFVRAVVVRVRQINNWMSDASGFAFCESVVTWAKCEWNASISRLCLRRLEEEVSVFFKVKIGIKVIYEMRKYVHPTNFKNRCKWENK